VKWTNATSAVSYLYEQLLDLVVVDNSRISPRSLTEASLGSPSALQTHATCKCGGTVWQQLHVLEVAGVQRVGCILVLRGQTLVNAPLKEKNVLKNNRSRIYALTVIPDA